MLHLQREEEEECQREQAAGHGGDYWSVTPVTPASSQHLIRVPVQSRHTQIYRNNNDLMKKEEQVFFKFLNFIETNIIAEPVNTRLGFVYRPTCEIISSFLLF